MKSGVEYERVGYWRRLGEKISEAEWKLPRTKGLSERIEPSGFRAGL